MNCDDCLNSPSFKCLCSNITLCEGHLGKHMVVSGDHRIENLIKVINPSEKQILDFKLRNWVMTLTSLKSEICFITNKTIKFLESHKTSLMLKIDSQITYYESFASKTKFKSSEFKEINLILSSALVKNQINQKPFDEAIEKFYSKETFSIISDPCKLKQMMSCNILETHQGGFKCLAISSDRKILITGSKDATVRVWDLESRNQTVCFFGHLSTVNCVAIFKNCKKIISGSDDQTLILRNLMKPSNLVYFRGHTRAVCSVDLTKDSKNIISCSRSGEMILWKLSNQEILKKIKFESVISTLVICNDNIYAGIGNSLQLLELANCKPIYTKILHESIIKSIALTSNQSYIITGSSDRLVKIFDMTSKSVYACLVGHSSEVTSLSVTSDDSQIISGSRDRSMILWNIKSKLKISQFTFHLDSVTGITTYSDFIISVSSDSRIGICRILSKTFEAFFNSKPLKVDSETILGDIIAFGCLNDVIYVDLNKTDKETVLSGHPDLVLATSLSSDFTFLLSSSKGVSDNLIIWNLQTKTKLLSLPGHQNSVLCVDISKDSRKAISGDVLGSLKVWDLNNLQLEFSTNEHKKQILSVKFTRNGKLAASSGIEMKILVWDLERKIKCKVLTDKSIIERVWITCDDKFIVFANTESGVKVWDYFKKSEPEVFRDLSELKLWCERDKELKFEITRYLF